MKDARSVIVEATKHMTDPDSLAILSRAFTILNREIATVTGRVEGGDRIDYLAMAQRKAREAWRGDRGSDGMMGLSTIKTPLGPLMCEARMGDGGWTSQYYLNGERIAVREIKALGLAQRPTTRNRRKKNGSD
jgi:hypothetical protein